MTTSVFLAIDLGTSSIKAAFVDEAGTMVATATVEYPLQYPHRDWVECDVRVYWESMRSAVRAANARRLAVGRTEVTAMSISCQGETVVCLDADSQPLRPAIVWLDNRADAEADVIGTRFGNDEIYARTGQVECVASWTACKILWLQRHEPAIFNATRSFLLLEDWLIQRLTGEAAGEYSLYPTTLLFDIRSREWWPAMLEMLAIDDGLLPPLVQPGTAVGHLRVAIAGELGLPSSLPVIAGGLDQVLASTAGGNVRPGVVTELTGTVLALATSLTALPPREHMLPIYLHVIPELYCALPYGQTGGLLLRWLRDNCFGDPARVSAPPSYDEIVQEAVAIPAGAGGVIVLPHFAGAYYPEFDMKCKGVISGLRLGHTRGHIVRASLEAIGYMLRSSVDAIRGIGIPVDDLTSLGPAANNRFWRQLKADICGVEIYRLKTDEASLLGAAVLAAVACGRYSNIAEGVESMSSRIDPLTPSSASSEVYERQLIAYRTTYRQLAPYFQAAT